MHNWDCRVIDQILPKYRTKSLFATDCQRTITYMTQPSIEKEIQRGRTETSAPDR